MSCAGNSALQLHLQLPLHDLWGVNAEGIRHTIGIVQGEHSIAPHVAMAMVQILFDGLHKRLQQLEFFQLGDKA